MKKIVIAGIFLLALAVSSCGGPSSKKGENNTKTESPAAPIQLTKATFLTQVANYETSPNTWKYLGDKPAIIDFYADWCGPCKTIAPIMEELAAEYAGQIYIYKIDTDKEQELATLFGIQSIPALLFIPMDKEPQMMQGAMPKSSFTKAINEILLR